MAACVAMLFDNCCCKHPTEYGTHSAAGPGLWEWVDAPGAPGSSSPRMESVSLPLCRFLSYLRPLNFVLRSAKVIELEPFTFINRVHRAPEHLFPSSTAATRVSTRRPRPASPTYYSPARAPSATRLRRTEPPTRRSHVGVPTRLPRSTLRLGLAGRGREEGRLLHHPRGIFLQRRQRSNRVETASGTRCDRVSTLRNRLLPALSF